LAIPQEALDHPPLPRHDQDDDPPHEPAEYPLGEPAEQVLLDPPHEPFTAQLPSVIQAGLRLRNDAHSAAVLVGINILEPQLLATLRHSPHSVIFWLLRLLIWYDEAARVMGMIEIVHIHTIRRIFLIVWNDEWINEYMTNF
jgi:hypothetical protein